MGLNRCDSRRTILLRRKIEIGNSGLHCWLGTTALLGWDRRRAEGSLVDWDCSRLYRSCRTLRALRTFLGKVRRGQFKQRRCHEPGAEEPTELACCSPRWGLLGLGGGSPSLSRCLRIGSWLP